MEKDKKNYRDTTLSLFQKFENVITIILSLLIGLIIIVSLIRVFEQFYTLFVSDFMTPENITFTDYQKLFGRIMTLIISLEFLSSILKVLKTHEIKTLVQDVILITALAVARKLIIYDYDLHSPAETIALGGLLVSIGIFYFLIKFKQQGNSAEPNS